MSNRQAYRPCPSDWTVRSIGDLFGRVFDRNLEGCQNVLTISAELGLVSQTEYFKRIVASDHLGNYFLLKKGDFAYNKSHSVGFPYGVVRRLLAYEKGVLSPLYICIRCRSQDVDGDYARTFFEANLLDGQLSRVADQGARDHGLLNVRPADFLAMKFWHPPIEEQRRIAEILDTADAAIHKTERLIAKLQLAKQGLLHDLLTLGIDDNGELRDPARHSEQFKDSMLGRIPESWQIRRLSECCSSIVDCPHTTPTYLKHGVLVARTSTIRNGDFDVANASYVSEAQYVERIARLRPESGDVIFAREAPVGEAFVIPPSMRICLGQRVMLLRPRVETLMGEYLVAQIYSGVVKRRISQITGGTTNPHLNVAEVRAFEIPIPPVEEQRAITQSLDTFEKNVASERVNLKKFISLKSGLMDDLLTGRVRVPLDTKATA